jgi:hypothetical protein
VLLVTAAFREVRLIVADEVIRGPQGDVLVPGEMKVLGADGFMLRRQDAHRVVVEILGPPDGQAGFRVVARLEFTNESFQRFVTGLVTVAQDAGRLTGLDHQTDRRPLSTDGGCLADG